MIQCSRNTHDVVSFSLPNKRAKECAPINLSVRSLASAGTGMPTTRTKLLRPPLSLNCEVCPGREGPIVFGEDSGCHVLSHTFNLHDFQARGDRSLYSFIVVMMDRVFLINSWPFLVKHFRALIDDLQAKVG